MITASRKTGWTSRTAIAVVAGTFIALGWGWTEALHESGAPAHANANAKTAETTRSKIVPDHPVPSEIVICMKVPLGAEQALREAESGNVPSEQRHELASRSLPEWVATDPWAAWRWAVAHDREWSVSGHPTMTELVLDRLAATTPEAIRTMLFADPSPAPSLVDQAVATLLQHRHVDAACGLLERWSLEATSEVPAFAPFERIAFALANDSVSRAIDWLSSLPISGGRDAGLGTVADVWATSAPSAAMAWAQSLPAGATREGVVERAFARWVERESEPALRWLVAHEAEPDADRLISRWLVVSEAVRFNPAAARPWIELIRDPALRAQTAVMVLDR